MSAHVRTRDATDLVGAVLSANAGLADGIEIIVSSSRSALTRYAASQIIQNTARNEMRRTPLGR